MPTRAEIADVIRTKNPKFKDLSDIEIEAIVGAADPRYRDLFNKASGVDPGLGPEKPPSPTQYEDASPRSTKLEALQRESQANAVPATVDTAVNAIPTATAMAAGAGGFAVGGPFAAIPAAGAGGATGETIRQFIQRARGKEGPRPLADRASDVVKEGMIQAGQEAFGQGVSGVQRAVAPAIYKYALSPSPRAQREFPTMAEDALAARLPISSRGQARATETATGHSAEADAMIAAAEQAGAEPLDLVKDILQPTVSDVGTKARNQAKLGRPQGTGDLAERVQNIQGEFQAPPPAPVPPPPRQTTPGYEALLEQQRQLGPQAALIPSRLFEPTSNEVRVGRELGSTSMTIPRRVISGPEPELPTPPPWEPFRKVGLTEAQGLKREAQDLSDSAYRAQERGAEINSVQTATDEALAKNLRTGLESRVEGLGAKNEQAQRAIGVERGITNARERSGGLRGAMVTGGVAAGPALALATGHPMAALGLGATGAAVKAATSPYALSRTAILFDQLGKHPVAQTNFYRALVEALRQGLAQPTDEASTPQQ